MGWTETGIQSGQKTVDFFRKECGDKNEILASAVRGGVFYAAVKSAKTGEVWPLIALFKRGVSKGGWLGYSSTIAYKDMDDTMGPNEADCPAKILDLLSPTDSEYANGWRARCRANIARAERLKGMRYGTIVTLSRPLKFGSLGEFDTLEYIRDTQFYVRMSETHSLVVRLPRSYWGFISNIDIQS